jgi:hypothetical protein
MEDLTESVIPLERIKEGHAWVKDIYQVAGLEYAEAARDGP